MLISTGQGWKMRSYTTCRQDQMIATRSMCHSPLLNLSTPTLSINVPLLVPVPIVINGTKLSCRFISLYSYTLSRVNCISCREYCRYSETLKTPCDHYYCRNCLVAFVEAFTHDESLFPLRCCQSPIPVAEVLPTLSLELRSLFQRKIAEFSVPTGDRLYCSNPNCSTFLGSSDGRLSISAIECPHCLVNTCPRCKEPAHPNEGCGVGALQALAKCRGWQTCPGCKTVVELNLGCNHITCRCRTQFCYLCAALWKTCNCAQ